MIQPDLREEFRKLFFTPLVFGEKTSDRHRKRVAFVDDLIRAIEGAEDLARITKMVLADFEGRRSRPPILDALDAAHAIYLSSREPKKREPSVG